MYGLILIIDVFKESQGQRFAEKQQWKAVVIALEACIPEVNREEIYKKIKEQTTEAAWQEASMYLLAVLTGNTFVLILGYGVHVFLA